MQGGSAGGWELSSDACDGRAPRRGVCCRRQPAWDGAWRMGTPIRGLSFVDMVAIARTGAGIHHTIIRLCLLACYVVCGVFKCRAAFTRPALPPACDARSTTVFSHSQTVVVCPSCNTVLCVPTGGKARLTEGKPGGAPSAGWAGGERPVALC